MAIRVVRRFMEIRGKNNINIFVMHPAGRTSPIQERQMTSVLDKNVFNLAVEGTFDDCQMIMKTTFADVPFKQAHSLGAVNSVNWARVLAQMVYYFYATFDVQKRTGESAVRFSVPTEILEIFWRGIWRSRWDCRLSN